MIRGGTPGCLPGRRDRRHEAVVSTGHRVAQHEGDHPRDVALERDRDQAVHEVSLRQVVGAGETVLVDRVLGRARNHRLGAGSRRRGVLQLHLQ